MTNLFRIANSSLLSGLALCWSEVKVDFSSVFTLKKNAKTDIFIFTFQRSQRHDQTETFTGTGLAHPRCWCG